MNNHTESSLAEAKTKVGAALNLIGRGFRIFPLLPNSKVPAIKGWKERATRNPDLVRQVWESGDYNIGVYCEDMVVIDVDVKNGKPGMASLLELGIDLATYTVRTPTGGLHVYYTGPNVGLSAGRIGSGLDVRSGGGYVVGAGSTIDGVPYTVAAAVDLRTAPSSLIERCGAASLRDAVVQLPATPLDTPAILDRATAYLRGEAHIAIEGSGGDDTTFRVAVTLKDHGVSQAMAFDLMVEHWNDRCLPPWSTEELLTKVKNAYAYGKKAPGSESPEAAFKGVVVPPVEDPSAWPDLKPIGHGLSDVPPFSPDLIPEALRPWIVDTVEVMQCPIEFVAVAAVTAAGSVIGRKVGIRAQEVTDWTEIPNLWGVVIGRPGVMKSPAIKQALGPVTKLEARAAAANRNAWAAYSAESDRYKFEQSAARSKASADAKRGALPDCSFFAVSPPAAPCLRRYLVHDATYEALGLILADNPVGVCVHRDEVVSLLIPLGREENAAARGFFLAGWNGDDSYSFDRITRDPVQIAACCLSLLGSTQPGRWREYLRSAIHGGAADDGFAQRFQLVVWPDVSPTWRDVDRRPDRAAIQRAEAVFDRLDALDPSAIGAEPVEGRDLSFLRFSQEALAAFRAWRAALETRVRSGDLHPAMEAHLSKYRGLAPKLALIFHLIDDGRGPVSLDALQRSLRWCGVLEAHANRAYGAALNAAADGAQTILKKVRAGDLPNPFTPREVNKKGWSALNTPEEVNEALSLLVDHGHLREERRQTGGRPSHVFHVNPKVIQ